MNGLDFLATADRLAQGPQESDWRSAISRSYYALFHHVRDLFLQHGLKLGPSGQAHFNLYAGLLHCGFPAATAMASRLDALRSERVRADYDMQCTVTQKLALDTVAAARALYSDLQALLKVIPAAQIVAGARKHLQLIGKLVP